MMVNEYYIEYSIFIQNIPIILDLNILKYNKNFFTLTFQ